uniref:Uncharacterized protein n=1 Tax=Anguilla anguilla TaxID=7936 RepID=A0A0E9TYH9_ANGAN
MLNYYYILTHFPEESAASYSFHFCSERESEVGVWD